MIVLRWIHLVSGITWIGLLYFFNLVNMPFLQELDAEQRSMVVRKLMPRALWWFRWSSLVTVLAGVAYWNHIVATDARVAVSMGQAASVGGTVNSFFLIWTLAFAVEMGMLMSPLEVLRKGAIFGTIMAVVVIAAAYIFLGLNQQGWESSRLLSIGIGGGLGWFMLLNVWGIVWRMQKKLIRWTEEHATKGTAIPPEAAKAARLTFLAARRQLLALLPHAVLHGCSQLLRHVCRAIGRASLQARVRSRRGKSPGARRACHDSPHAAQRSAGMCVERAKSRGDADMCLQVTAVARCFSFTRHPEPAGRGMTAQHAAQRSAGMRVDTGAVPRGRHMCLQATAVARCFSFTRRPEPAGRAMTAQHAAQRSAG